LLIVLIGLPQLWSLLSALHAAANWQAWSALLIDPQMAHALALSLWTGIASTTLALVATAKLLSRMGWGSNSGARWSGILSYMLALPHAAFAIGLAALLAPSGWFLRLLSPWATGFTTPPAWATTQDPWGIGLIAVLVLKETPFLLWIAIAHLQRADVSHRMHAALCVACTMGYDPNTAWWRVAWPDLLTQLRLPLLAVLAYGLGVVDVAIIIGPANPPTLGTLAWQWLQNADAFTQAKGAAAAWSLFACTTLCAIVFNALLKAQFWRRNWTVGVSPGQAFSVVGTARHWKPGNSALRPLTAPYLLVMAALLTGSIIGVWPFPYLVPQSLTWSAWRSVLDSGPVIRDTLWLALASTTAGLCWSIGWLECLPKRRTSGPAKLVIGCLIYLPLGLPSVLWVLGLHRLSIAWNIDGTAAGVLLAHTLASLPYVLLSIQGAYRAFDPRQAQLSASLGRTHWAFLWRVKWPLLKSVLASGFAVGFAVSVAQYLPTLYLGAGRFASVSTEAVTLAAGGQRSLASAFAWLQWLLPALMFALAARLGKTDATISKI
jgi:putative thiamine transport system permease protein